MENKIFAEHDSAYEYYRDIRKTWTEKEAVLMGKTLDEITCVTRSKVHDPRLSTIVLERAARVMAQMASGKVQAMTRKDKGKSLFMDLLLTNHIIPGAKSQFSVMTKLRMVDLYSMVYGDMSVLYRWNISKEYIGPDFELIPIRDIIPQPGAISIQTADWVDVRTPVSKGWLKEQIKTGKWKRRAVRELLQKSKDKSYSKDTEDSDKKSYNEDQVTGKTFTDSKEDSQQIMIITRYYRDNWVTFSSDHKLVLRDIQNSNGDGKIPIITKYCFPLLDQFHGLGEFERGMSLEYAKNSVINMYMDGVKISMAPPKSIVYKDVIPSTIKNEPGAKWIVKNQEAVKVQNVNPQGIATFQSTYQFLVAALLNQAGTTDTTVSAATDPGMGKTPDAIQFLGQRQNSRDAWDRFMMEQFISELYEAMMNLVIKRQVAPIRVDIFENEIKRIQEIQPDVMELFESGKAGQLIVKPQELGGDKRNIRYKFFIDTGSTMKREESQEYNSLMNLAILITKFPQAIDAMREKGKDIDFSELFKRLFINSGTQDWDKIIVDFEDRANGNMEVNFDDPSIKEAWDQVQSIINGNNPGGQGAEAVMAQ